MDEAPRIISENEETLKALAESDLRTARLARSVLDHFDLGEPERSLSPSPSTEDPPSTSEPEPIRGVLDF